MMIKSLKVLKFVLPRNTSLAGLLVDVALVVVDFSSLNNSSSISITTTSLSSAGLLSIRRLVLD